MAVPPILPGARARHGRGRAPMAADAVRERAAPARFPADLDSVRRDAAPVAPAASQTRPQS